MPVRVSKHMLVEVSGQPTWGVFLRGYHFIFLRPPKFSLFTYLFRGREGRAQEERKGEERGGEGKGEEKRLIWRAQNNL